MMNVHAVYVVLQGSAKSFIVHGRLVIVLKMCVNILLVI
jgi:hypothetical protein